MSWENQDYSDGDEHRGFFGRPGGDWQGVRPTLDNPMSWSLFIIRISRIDIRVHALFLLYIVVILGISLYGKAGANQTTPIGFMLMAMTMGSLFMIVLVHEFGHCLACRWSGGSANEILMWPLGGLAYCQPPRRWKAHFITAAGGPMVNVIICLVAIPFLGVITGKWLGVALPNPLNPFSGIYDVSHSLALQGLYIINMTSLILLLFNLLPIFPLDGGRLVQALLWSRKGYANSMRLAVRTGFVGAILFFIFGAVIGNMLIVGISFFGGFTCWYTNKQLEFTESFMGFEDDQYMINHFEEEAEKPKDRKKAEREEKRLEKKAKQQEEETLEVDRLLEKIATEGMGGLTSREKKFLENHSQRKRQDG